MKAHETRTRRRLLTTSLPVAIGLLAGCQGDFARGRELYIQDVEAQPSDAEWTATVTVTSNDNTDRNGFRNVRLVGYSEDGTVLCRTRIGDMVGDSMTIRETVTLACEQRPHAIVPEADSSPCDENTFVDIRIYDGETDSWRTSELECGEEIPPERTPE